MKINKIAIVGGGTAGWLVANHLGKALKGDKSASITLIESLDIPTIGVGEGTVPMMRDTLQHFGISEAEFISRCDATFKQSIKFENWLDKDRHGDNNFYHHLFDYPFPMGEDLTNYWLNKAATSTYSQTVSFQEAVCENNLSPKHITDPEYAGQTTYAYHLDAKKFAKLLAENATQNFDVSHVICNVTDVQLNKTGGISSLITDNFGELEFDFYIDCSGFSSYLLGNKLGVKFIEQSSKLLIDRAITVQVPTNGKESLKPYTRAVAHQAGWIWDIPLPHRRGVGFVYASSYMSYEEALQKLSHYVGPDIESLTTREIPMQVGYRERFWQDNCVAIGLSQGFVEPLEATAILVTDFCAQHLAERFPRDREVLADLAKRFNDNVSYAWSKVIDFVQLHYYLSDRVDSAFWQDVKNEQMLSEDLRNKLLRWKYFSPKSTDFTSKYEVFDIENYLYVLYGMKFLTRPQQLNSVEEDKMAEIEAKVKQHAEYLSAELTEQRELIDKIKQYGLTAI
ncbi:tryptophan halogenase [Shewanella sairae]|uniref:Tryptophan halogenase n=1 Tax=Shewanella sairae TaxID=190310 RepID=A0ABQ4PE96_9GAMM|nr:tryptophan halogenase family protein [Shewanella sairae]MCL1128664.1 tryptophan 7-halogenase [Shewanella sairae]GIU45870.1 tryptophan halogenase [Shewanella sairae]